MKSAVVWVPDRACERQEFGSVRLAVVDGDWTRFRDHYVTNDNYCEPLSQDLIRAALNPDGSYKLNFCGHAEFATAVRLGAPVVVCGTD